MSIPITMNLDHLPKGMIGKIQALLRLEENAGTPEEAANASGKIRDILMKYNLDLYTVSQATAEKKKPGINHFEYNPEDLTKPHEGKWVLALVKVIARFNMVEILTKKRSDDIILIGTEVNIEITWYTLQQLTVRLRTMAKDNFKKYEGKEKRNTYIRGYYLGAVAGIQTQLSTNAAREVYNAKIAAQRRATHVPVSAEETSAIAIISMGVEMMKSVQDYMNQTFTFKYSQAAGPRSKGLNGRAQGREDGEKISINAGLKGGSSAPGHKLLN
jgi:hypothetical protein